MDIKESLFDNLEELFGERLELIERTTEYGNLIDIPSALHSFYKNIRLQNAFWLYFHSRRNKKNVGQIPNLEKLVATIRSREISACLVLQAKSQLKAIYKDNADTIIGNMDS